MKQELITSCTCVQVNGRTKTVLRTADIVKDVTLTDKTERTWGACSNLGEPFDFQTHIFYLPDGTLDEPVTVHWTSRSDQTDVTAILTPDMVNTTTLADFICESDHHIKTEYIETETICDGVIYKFLKCVTQDCKPVCMYALFVDAKKAYLTTGTASDGFAHHTETQTVMEMANAAVANGKDVVAATNADFFDWKAEFSPYTPAGLCIKEGKLIANADSKLNFFGTDRDGNTVISNFIEEPHLQGQLFCAVGGREIFLRDGNLAEVSPCEPFSSLGHPRTCAGVTEDGTIILLVVDGRQPEFSNGASIVDLARVMQSFGVQKAINLDGGQSSNFIVNKGNELVLLNRPANLHRPEVIEPREVFNSILVVKK